MAHKTVLITRPQTQGDGIAAQVALLGFTPLLAPLLEIVPTPEASAAPPLEGVQALLFTSATGVRLFAQSCPARSLPTYTVGDATAAAATLAGFTEVISAGRDGAALARLVAARLDPLRGRILHIAGESVAFDLCGWLSARGFFALKRVLYATVPVSSLPMDALGAFSGGEVTAVLFFSARTAVTFAKLITGTPLVSACRGSVALCLSKAVAAPVAGLSWQALGCAPTPTSAALVGLLEPLAAGL